METVNTLSSNSDLSDGTATVTDIAPGTSTPNIEEKTVTFLGKKVKGISGSTIKIIAIISMLIDHTAAVLLEPTWYRIYVSQMKHGTVDKYGTCLVFHSFLYKASETMRGIGRLGFPIFCFLLVEGFLHTRNKAKYVFRLGLFALISEVPFDLAFNGHILETSSQNVFFTLFIGMVVIITIDKILNIQKIKPVFRYIICVPIVVAGMALAKFMMTDYDAAGVLTIVVMYFFRYFKLFEMYSGCLSLTLFCSMGEAYAFANMIPIALYNGKRGLKIKYFFYAFYPVHLLILAGIARLLNIPAHF